MTEDEVRDLLRLAAGTIPIAQSGSIQGDVTSMDERNFVRRHTSFTAVAAAVLVAGVITTSFVLANQDDPDKAPTASSSPSTSAATPLESVSVPTELSPTPLPDSSTTALVSPPPGSAKADIAQKFVTFAVGGKGEVPWSANVPVFYGKERVAVLTRGELDDPNVWDLCPANAAEYAGRRCPVSPLATMQTAKDEGSAFTIEDGLVSTLGCDLVPPLRDPEYVDVVSIRPGKERQDCVTDFVVALYLNDAGQVAAVEFVLGSP